MARSYGGIVAGGSGYVVHFAVYESFGEPQVSGRRRFSEQQARPLRALGIALTPDVIEKEKWNAFWDAPLETPGTPGTDLDLPRTEQEIRRATSRYQVTGCRVKTDGARLELIFPGLSLA